MSNDSIQKKLSKIRDYFPLLKNYTFINSASHPPLGLPIRKRLDEFYDLMQDTPFDKDEFIFEFIESARKKVAKMFNCEPDEIAITPSTSYGINIAAFGVLKPGDTVLLPENEFPTNVFPFMNLKNNGVNVKFLKCPEGYATLDDIDSNLTPDVKLFSISWVQFYNG
ncbi:MAG: aminotransferase class V-fold PLP-dependent enzyme, partial [candidate division Zixibacteria bacterium]|nr:aminotransferase class V-fold PLP-dependent enzyme [candidate division Zixibacteria bacterium]